MIKINFKNGCLFILLLIAFGLIGIWYRQWEMESFYSQSIRECLENQPDDNKSNDNSNENNTDKKMCDEAYTLTLINTRLDKLEKTSDKHDVQIKSNTDTITKTSSDLKSLLDEIEKTKAGLNKATKEQSLE